MEDKQMVHYLYRLTFKQDPRYYYYGVHSTVRQPENDGYYGSGGAISKYKNLFGKDCFNKDVLATFSTREELLQEEQKIVADLWKSDPFCLNQTKGGAESGKFDNKGTNIINNGIQEKFVYPEFLDKFLKEGWQKGRLPRVRDKMKGRYTGYITLHKGDLVCRVPKEKVDSLSKDGWATGLPVGFLEEKRARQLGHITVHKDDQERHIALEELAEYEATGWLRGRSEKAAKTLSSVKKGTVRINDGEVEMIVARKDLSKYLKEGWKKGYVRGTTGKFGHKGNVHTRGKVGIYKDGVDKKVAPEEVDKFLALGWKKGRTPYAKNRH